MALRISMLVIGLILITSTVAGMYSVVDDLAGEQKYNKTVEDRYMKKINRTQEISNEMNQTYNELADLKPNPTAFLSLPVVLFNLMISMITLPFNIMTDLVFIIGQTFNLPGWAISMMIAVVTTLIVGTLIALALRYREV